MVEALNVLPGQFHQKQLVLDLIGVSLSQQFGYKGRFVKKR
jgi:hypothetical protein